MTIRNVLPSQFKNWEECLKASENYLENNFVAFPVIKDFTIANAMACYPDPDEPTEILLDADFIFMMVEKEKIKKQNWIEKDSGYCKELPEYYRTWLDFYDEIKAAINEDTEIIQVQRGRFYREYLLRHIKDSILEEFLAERMTLKDVRALFNQIEISVNIHNHEEDKRFRSAKRILLTQAKRH
jgi:hypothetical protein